VKTFFTLLQILLPELERFTTEESENDDGTKNKHDSVTVVARRVLPAIRQYSSWLLSNSTSLLVEPEDRDTSLYIQIREFWKLYASTLSLLASTFDIVNLPEINYLLDEDEETLGFRPFMNKETARRYVDAEGQRKPQLQDKSVERHHTNDEMLYRIRAFFIDGLDLVHQKVCIVFCFPFFWRVLTFPSEYPFSWTITAEICSFIKKTFLHRSSPAQMAIIILFHPRA
jgi:hypothetical protein